GLRGDQLIGRRMARLLAREPLFDHRREVVVAGAGPERTAQIDLALVEEAPAEVAVGGEPGAIAATAERLGHGGDDADAAGPIAASVADTIDPGGLVEGLRRELQFALQPRADLGRGHHAQVA